MGEKEVPIQNIWRTVTEISVTVDVCSATVKYYILVRGTSEGDKSQSHISSHFAPIELILPVQNITINMDTVGRFGLFPKK